MGCPIRAEIWGLIVPGNPALAAKLCVMDGTLDHAGNSVYFEQFWAAMIAQAFVDSDLNKLIACRAAPYSRGEPRGAADPRRRALVRGVGRHRLPAQPHHRGVRALRLHQRLSEHRHNADAPSEIFRGHPPGGDRRLQLRIRHRLHGRKLRRPVRAPVRREGIGREGGLPRQRLRAHPLLPQGNRPGGGSRAGYRPHRASLYEPGIRTRSIF